MDKETLKNIPMFFILGRARSGTTLLKSILDNHPNILIPNEAEVIKKLYAKYSRITDWNNNVINNYCDDLFDNIYIPFFKMWNIDKELLKQKLINDFSGENDFATISKAVFTEFKSVFPKQDIKYVGDKTCENIRILDDIHTAFPLGTKYIHLIRDYRDNILSAFGLKSPVEFMAIAAYNWKYYNQMIDEFKKKHTDLFYTVRYEDLTTNPEKYISEICKFLNIKYYPEMLLFGNKAGKYFEKSEHYSKLHHNLNNTVNNKSVGRWKTKMTKTQLRIVDAVVGTYSEELGYERTYKSSPNLLIRIIICLQIYTSKSIRYFYYNQRLRNILKY